MLILYVNVSIFTLYIYIEVYLWMVNLTYTIFIWSLTTCSLIWFWILVQLYISEFSLSSIINELVHVFLFRGLFKHASRWGIFSLCGRHIVGLRLFSSLWYIPNCHSQFHSISWFYWKVVFWFRITERHSLFVQIIHQWDTQDKVLKCRINNHEAFQAEWKNLKYSLLILTDGWQQLFINKKKYLQYY